MPNENVFVHAAELAARFDSTAPEGMSFLELLGAAGEKATRAAGIRRDQIGAVVVATMGNFPAEEFPGFASIEIARRLRLTEADALPTLQGASDAGALGLRHAVDIARGRHAGRYVLVVAGEQMNPSPTDDPQERARQRAGRQRALDAVVEASERCYGLSMIRMGDLLTDAMCRADAIDPDRLRDRFLPALAIGKYERGASYRFAQYADKGPLTQEAYSASPSVSRFFRLHDVAPTSTGAVALLLSTRRCASGIAIAGVGHGWTDPRLTNRNHPVTRSSAVRRAFANACLDAELPPSALADTGCAFVHDAFPVIEYTFLRELGLSRDEAWERMSRGWSNPYGGLKVGGHAIGASGLLQVAQCVHSCTGDVRYVEPSSAQPELRRTWTSSVGAVLTSVTVTIIERYPPKARPHMLPDAEAELQAYRATTAELTKPTPPPPSPSVIASTTLRDGQWVHLIDNDESTRIETGRTRSLALSEGTIKPGTAVEPKTGDDGRLHL